MTASPAPGSPGEIDRLVALAEQHQAARRFGEAERAYRRIVELRPGLAEAYLNLGNALLGQGRLDEAAAEYERALAHNAALFQAYNNLAGVLQRQGQLERAVASYERALALEPGLPEVHAALAGVLMEQGQLERAAVHFQQALAARPDFPPVHFRLANLLSSQGQLDRAAEHYQQALTQRPDFPEAHNNLGIALAGLGRLDEAVAHYHQALDQRPDFASAHNNLANALGHQGRLDEALAHYRRALAIQPNYIEGHQNLAAALVGQGRLDEAIAHLQTVSQLLPDSAQAHYRLGNALRDRGWLDQALVQYDRALTLDPHYAEVYFDRAMLKTFRPGDADLAALEALAAGAASIPEEKMPAIHFALGKALEDVKDHRRAMQHWIKGNALKRPQVDYDEAAYRRDFQLAAETFDANLLARFYPAGDPSPLPIFILGMPRSGSSLIEQILASHPLVLGAGELHTLDRLVHQGGGIQALATLQAEDWRRLGEQYLAGLPPLPEGKTRITDKMPGNFMYVGLIHLILPSAKIIHTTRNPVDTCVSCFSRLLSVGHHFSYDLAELGRYYRYYRELMEHWRSVLPAGAMLDVAYEDVVDDLETQSRRMLDYLGLPWDDRCLSFHTTVRPVATASSAQVRRPLYRSGVARWRQYEQDLGPLLDELEGCLPSP